MKDLKEELKPNTCLECIGGEMTGKMFDFIVDKGVVITYGLLSEKPISGISVFNLIGHD